MKHVIVYRNGEEKLRVPAEVRNGILRHGKNILINSDLIEATGRTKTEVAAKIKAGKITPDIEAMGMRIGDNGNGLVVRWAEDVEAERRAKAQAEYDALPAEVRASREERNAIERLYERAERSLNHDTDDMNVERGYSLRGQADRRLAAWRETYPQAATAERAKNLLRKAGHEDHLAAGALTYDADGWISPEDQQRRHDEGKAKAAKMRDEADKLLNSIESAWRC